MAAPRRPQIVVFDVNETLFGLDRLGDAMEEAGLPGHAIDLWFARVLQDGFALSATARLPTFRTLARHHLERVLRSFGIHASQDLTAYVLDTFAELEAYEDVRPAFERLRDAGVTVATLTNGSADTTRALIAHNGLEGLVDRCFDAAMVGQWKPRPEPYRMVVDAYGTDPEAVALVAVHSWDVHGACLAGLTTGWAARLEGEQVPIMEDAHVTGRSLTEVVDGLLALPSP